MSAVIALRLTERASFHRLTRIICPGGVGSGLRTCRARRSRVQRNCRQLPRM